MIICAALKIQIEGLFHTTIIPCRRHGDGHSIIADFKNEKRATVLEEGFITHTGEFLNRTDAYTHAMQCGQLTQTTRWYKEDHGDRELYSEDLY